MGKLLQFNRTGIKGTIWESYVRNVPEFLGIFFKNYKRNVSLSVFHLVWLCFLFCLIFKNLLSSNSASLDVNCEASQPAQATLYLMRAPQLQLQRQEFLVHSQRMAFTVLLLRLLSNFLLPWLKHSLQWEKRNGAMGILSLMHNKSWLALVVFQGRSRSQIADCGLFWRQAGVLLASEILLVWKQ